MNKDQDHQFLYFSVDFQNGETSETTELSRAWDKALKYHMKTGKPVTINRVFCQSMITLKEKIIS